MLNCQDTFLTQIERAAKMDIQQIMALVSRWLHLLPAIILVGGALFMRFCLVPSISEETRVGDEIREGVRKRWAKLVMLSTLFLLISGLYNAYLKAVGFQLDGIYLGLLCVKILLALVVFFFAALLAGRSEKAQNMRKKELHWLNILCAAMLLLVLIAGYLKIGVYPPKEPKSPTTSVLVVESEQESLFHAKHKLSSFSN